MTGQQEFDAMREASRYTLEQCATDKMRYLKAAYILAGGDSEKVRQAIDQADDVTLRELRNGSNRSLT